MVRGCPYIYTQVETKGQPWFSFSITLHLLFEASWLTEPGAYQFSFTGTFISQRNKCMEDGQSDLGAQM